MDTAGGSAPAPAAELGVGQGGAGPGRASLWGRSSLFSKVTNLSTPQYALGLVRDSKVFVSCCLYLTHVWFIVLFYMGL